MIVIGVDLIKAGCGSGSEWLARHSIIMWLYVSRSVLYYKSLFELFQVCIAALGGTDGLTEGRAELSSKLAVGQNSPAEKLWLLAVFDGQQLCYKWYFSVSFDWLSGTNSFVILLQEALKAVQELNLYSLAGELDRCQHHNSLAPKIDHTGGVSVSFVNEWVRQSQLTQLSFISEIISTKTNKNVEKY